MIPAMGPRSAEYPSSQPTMPAPASFHGSMTAPAMAVMRPPILNEIFLGARLAMSLAGETTLAAMLTEMLATATPNTENSATATRVPADSSSGAESVPGAWGEV